MKLRYFRRNALVTTELPSLSPGNQPIIQRRRLPHILRLAILNPNDISTQENHNATFARRTGGDPEKRLPVLRMGFSQGHKDEALL